MNDEESQKQNCPRPEEFADIDQINPDTEYRLAWYVKKDSRIQYGYGWRKGEEIVSYFAEFKARHASDGFLTWIEDKYNSKFR